MALLGRHDFDELAEFAAQKTPALLQVADQEWAMYWVSTSTRRMPELMQLDSGKSMMRNLPPKGTAGLAMTGEFAEATAAPAGEDQGQRILGDKTDESLRGFNLHGISAVWALGGSIRVLHPQAWIILL